MKLFLLFFLFCVFTGNTFSQELSEYDELNSGKFNSYKSNGLDNSKGLIFSIHYPESYKIMPEDNSGAVVGFARSVTTGSSIRIAIEKIEGNWKEALSKNLKLPTNQVVHYLLSEKLAKEQIGEGKFLGYKNGFFIAGEDASYFDFSYTANINVGNEVIPYLMLNRVYTFYHNEYEIKLFFTRSGLASNKLELIKDFEDKKTFYSFIANTFVFAKN